MSFGTVRIYWHRNPSQTEILSGLFFVVFYGICSIDLNSSVFAGYYVPRTVPIASFILHLWPRAEPFPCSQDIHGSWLDAFGEETYECIFCLPQALMFCGGLSVCLGQRPGCSWPWSEESSVELSVTVHKHVTGWRGFTGEE